MVCMKPDFYTEHKGRKVSVTYESCRGSSVPNSLILSLMLNLLRLSTVTNNKTSESNFSLQYQCILKRTTKENKEIHQLVLCIVLNNVVLTFESVDENSEV